MRLLPVFVCLALACTRPSPLCPGSTALPGVSPPALSCDGFLVGSLVCSLGGQGGYRCLAAGCWSALPNAVCTEPDAGEPDAGEPDAGEPDAGGPDASVVDPPIPDGGGCLQVDFQPPPDAGCTPDRLDLLVCPQGLAGYGYRCAEKGCWSYFFDGPCAFSSPLTDGGPTVKYCTPVSSPYKPFEACTPALEGALRCGPDYGYRCVGGCWDFFFDGACAKPDA